MGYLLFTLLSGLFIQSGFCAEPELMESDAASYVPESPSLLQTIFGQYAGLVEQGDRETLFTAIHFELSHKLGVF